MAVYKLFPIKDNSLYSFYPNMNSGLDEINQISNLNQGVGTSPQVARIITEFSQEEIEDTLNNIISGSQWTVNFKQFIATAQGIVESIFIEVHPVASYWWNGSGKYLDVPQSTDGSGWVSPAFASSPLRWPMSGSDAVGHRITGSFNSLFSPLGGGSWYVTGSNNMGWSSTQSFDTRSDKDLDVEVKTVVEKWYSSSIAYPSTASLPNYGFLTKFENQAEFNQNPQIQPVMQFYSVDTNTIYPPQLEFKWDDYETVLTGSATGSILKTTNIVSSLAENPGVFTPQGINRFRFNVAPKYPERVWTTSSLYTSVSYLPTSSYYGVKDLDTNEFVVDFDTTYTRLSSDIQGNYFDLYMNGLEPERYYKILVKTVLKGSTLILDDNYYFKVVNTL
tara:strand:+ start:1063 stop:2235 length:1173 start_codon:yes stop_codon:yes gene_type:complete